MPQYRTNIRSVALEGGGGKGNAYLGAIKALQEQGIFNLVTDYSGTSAGAITAMLLSMKMDFEQIYNIITMQDFNEFFDLPNPTREIGLFGPYYKYSHQPSKEEIDKLIAQAINPLGQKNDLVSQLLYLVPQNVVASSLQALSYDQDFKDSRYLMGLLADHLPGYIDQLTLDCGLFSGIKILRFFEKMTQGVTFQEHRDTYHNTLRIIGANFGTGQMQVFSWETTPNFPVALAVRISMGIPGLYKPVRITMQDLLSDPKMTSEAERNMLEGVWVDGGLFDNAPVRYTKQEETLLLRLGSRVISSKMENLKDLLLQMFQMATGGIGGGQVNNSTFDMANVIELDTVSLDLLKFNLDAKTLKDTVQRSYDKTMDYFWHRKFDSMY